MVAERDGDAGEEDDEEDVGLAELHDAVMQTEETALVRLNVSRSINYTQT